LSISFAFLKASYIFGAIIVFLKTCGVMLFILIEITFVESPLCEVLGSVTMSFVAEPLPDVLVPVFKLECAFVSVFFNEGFCLFALA